MSSGPDALDRREHAVQHMKSAVVGADPLQGQHIQGFLDHADDPRIALGSSQISHRVLPAMVMLKHSWQKAVLDLRPLKRLRELLRELVWRPQEEESQPGSRLRPNARQALQRVDQFLDWFRKKHGHGLVHGTSDAGVRRVRSERQSARQGSQSLGRQRPGLLQSDVHGREDQILQHLRIGLA